MHRVNSTAWFTRIQPLFTHQDRERSRDMDESHNYVEATAPLSRGIYTMYGKGCIRFLLWKNSAKARPWKGTYGFSRYSSAVGHGYQGPVVSKKRYGCSISVPVPNSPPFTGHILPADFQCKTTPATIERWKHYWHLTVKYS